MADDENVKELVRKVRDLVDRKHGGSYEKAFAHYAKKDTKDGKVNRSELQDLLSDAGIGTWATRGAWASGITKKLDRDGDAMISAKEFEAVYRS